MDQTNTTTQPAKEQQVREPAVAGLFYPKEPDSLSKTLDSLLGAASGEPIANLKAFVCPHAGYQYSGPIAATAYKRLSGSSYMTVIVMAPSHYVAFKGVSVCAADAYQTPLGKVVMSDKARKLAGTQPFVLEPRCAAHRPGWWPQSSRSAPPAGQDTPETWEHSGEVQVPFLQKVLREFKLVSLVFGEVDPEEAARGLAQILDDETLVVASSDLSHYHPYKEAKQLDDLCVRAVCDMDIEGMRKQEACGQGPILTLMHLAKAKGWKPQLLDCRNSGDTAGDKGRVVGYASIAFSAQAQPAKAASSAESVTADEQKLLLELARKTVKQVASRGALPDVDSSKLSSRLKEPKGCFVTLTKRGALRGCIGHIFPKEPLYKAVIENAQSAAINDYRFPPVTADEVDKLALEVSVLTEPKPLSFTSPEDLLAKLQPHKDGVVLQIGMQRATYLPQVWEQISDKVSFLNSLSQKAGCPANAWRSPGVSVLIYHAQAFHETRK